jgi:single stranded DNA-binding protein
MAQPTITVLGIVATQPAVQTTKRGTPYAAFRLAQTERRFNPRTNRWEDGDTSWYSVTCWRSFGENVAQSLKVGQPVVVTGRLKMREFTTDDGTSRQQAELHAIAVGHDIKRGVSSFTKVSRPATEFIDEDDEVSAHHQRLAAQSANSPWSEPGDESENGSAESGGSDGGDPVGQQGSGYGFGAAAAHEQADKQAA